MTVRRLLLLLSGGAMLTAQTLLAGTGAAVQPTDIRHVSEHLANLVASLRPAVVQIRTEADPSTEGTRRPIAGFVTRPSDVVLTVNHAFPAEPAAQRVHVEFSSGRTVPAQVIGRDPRTDLAIVQMETRGDVPGLRLGDSDRVRVGELVVALGHPYRLRGAVSLGVVSWMGAPPQGGLPGFDFLYTDAATNPGNSGGPLVNLAGEVIGVTGWAARSGSVGVAIPSNLVKLVLHHLMADGRVSWGWLGVRIAEVDAAALEGPRPSETRGMLISDVAPGAPAEVAGLGRGDIVVAMNGTRIDRARDFERRIAETPAGTAVRLAWLRDGDRYEVDVTLASYGEAAGTAGRTASSTFF